MFHLLPPVHHKDPEDRNLEKVQGPEPERLHYFMNFNKKRTYFWKDDVDIVIDVLDLSSSQL